MPFEIRKDPNRVLICGTGSGWELIPKESGAIIYALNDFIFFEKYGIRFDKLFILDVLDEKPQIVSGINNLGEVIKRINSFDRPLIAPFKYAEIPLSEAFPLEKCKERFGAPYFTNTIAYMVAYALLEGAKEIDMYGVNQASSGEYFYEKCGVEFWLGIAIGMGVKVTIHGDKSELLTTKSRFGGGLLYGYNETYDQIIQLKEKFGEGVIKKVLAPQKPYSRTIRRIN